MIATTEALVLKVIPHSDKHDIVSLYSSDRGRFSVVCGAPGGRRRRPVPLTLIEGKIDFSSRGFLHRMRSYSILEPFAGIQSSPVKTVSAMFIADFLDRLLCESLPEPGLWKHITELLRLYSGLCRGIGDFNIYFTLSLLPYSGIMPDLEGYRKGSVFDMRSGGYVSALPMHEDYIAGKESKLVRILLCAPLEGMRHFRFSGKIRGKIIDCILKYYSIHLPAMNKVSAHKVLSQLF